jgi:two-component system sensor histidine kinase RstB
MRRLYAQIVAAVATALLLGWSTIIVFVIPPMQAAVRQQQREQLLALGFNGTLPPPPLAPLVITFLVFSVVLTLTASALVGVPLVRRLRRVRHAIGELGRGNWAARMDPATEGALSDLADSINRTAEQLQRQFQDREALLQAVSHEMGTPLARMRFHIELFERQLTTAEHGRRLEALSRDLDELDDLSSELVNWMENDAATAAKTSFDVRSVIEALIQLERDRTGQPLCITLAAAPGVIQLRADVRLFERAVENLLRNALRYAQSRVVVEVGAEPGTVVVEIRDDGPGIPPDQWTRVLEPFVRIDTPRTRAHRGLGLGLAIVRRIVEAHGGQVTVGHAAEGGTLIRTTWPALP